MFEERYIKKINAELKFITITCDGCKKKVKICSECYHGNIYCPPCKIIAKINSHKNYRGSIKGKKTRAECESRRRKKIRDNIITIDAYKKMGGGYSSAIKNYIIEKVASIGSIKNKTLRNIKVKNRVKFFKIQNRKIKKLYI